MNAADIEKQIRLEEKAAAVRKPRKRTKKIQDSEDLVEPEPKKAKKPAPVKVLQPIVTSKRKISHLDIIQQPTGDNVSSASYLDNIFFDRLLGRVPFALPSKWPQERIVVISNLRRRVLAQVNAINFTSVSFLNRPSQRAVFQLFLMLMAMSRNQILSFEGHVRSLNRPPQTAIDQLYSNNVWVTIK